MKQGNKRKCMVFLFCRQEINVNKHKVESRACGGTLSFTYDALGRKWKLGSGRNV
jgi:hypothetical protein